MSFIRTFIFFLIFFVSNCFGSTYYFSDCGVDSDVLCVPGSDVNAGTSSILPKKTYAEFIRMLRDCTPGDNFYIAGGAALTQNRGVVTFNAITNLVTLTAHGFTTNQRIAFISSAIDSDANGILPTPIQESYGYAVTVVDPNTFSISYNPGDSPIDITSSSTTGSPFYAYPWGGIITTAPVGTEYTSRCTVGKFTPLWGANATPIIWGNSAQYLSFITRGGVAPFTPTGGITFQDINFKGKTTTVNSVTLSAASPGSVPWTAHGFTPGTVIVITATTGTLPTFTTTNGGSGTLEINHVYFVQSVIDADHFTLASSLTGNTGNRYNFTSSSTGNATLKSYSYIGFQLSSAAQDVTFNRVSFTGFQNPIGSSDSTTTSGKVKNLVISNSSFTDAPSICLALFGGIRITVESNTFSGCGSGDIRLHTMYLSGSSAGLSSPSTGVVIRFNSILHSSIGADGKCKGVVIDTHNTWTDWTIEGNSLILTQAEQGPGCYFISAHPADLDPDIEIGKRLTIRANKAVNPGNVAYELGGCISGCIIENNEATWESATSGTTAVLVALHNANVFAQPNPGRLGYNSGVIIRNNSGYVDSCLTGDICSMVQVDNEAGNNIIVNNLMKYGSGSGTGLKYAVSFPAPSTVTFTLINGLPIVVNWTSYAGMPGGQITCTTNGTLPYPLSVDTPYYIITEGLAANSFEISSSLGGAAINYSNGGAGSGTHTCSVVPDYLVTTARNNAVYNATSWLNGGYTGLATGAITTDPLLVATPAVGNGWSFATQVTSPLKTAGNVTYGSIRDVRYRSRGTTPDIGSYQYGASASSVPPATATNLR